jgi:hypothetical protein
VVALDREVINGLVFLQGKNPKKRISQQAFVVGGRT